MKLSREAGAEEPLAEALEVTAASEAGKLLSMVGPPAGSPISKKLVGGKNVTSCINYAKMGKVMSSVLSLIHIFVINLLCCIIVFAHYLLIFPLSATIPKTIGKFKQ